MDPKLEKLGSCAHGDGHLNIWMTSTLGALPTVGRCDP